MQICRVVGTVVSTQKNKKLEGAKLMLVQPLTLEDTPRGTTLLAIDSVGAGIGEKVLVVIEGKAAGDALGKKAAAVDAAIIGIIDSVRGRAHERRRAARARARDARAARSPRRAGAAATPDPARCCIVHVAPQPLPVRRCRRRTAPASSSPACRAITAATASRTDIRLALG